MSISYCCTVWTARENQSAPIIVLCSRDNELLARLLRGAFGNEVRACVHCRSTARTGSLCQRRMCPIVAGDPLSFTELTRLCCTRVRIRCNWTGKPLFPEIFRSARLLHSGRLQIALHPPKTRSQLTNDKRTRIRLDVAGGRVLVEVSLVLFFLRASSGDHWRKNLYCEDDVLRNDIPNKVEDSSVRRC